MAQVVMTMGVNVNNIHDFLRVESKELRLRYEKHSLTGSGTPQEVADYREQDLRQFVERMFPFPFRISKGIVSDSFGARSDSVDCVLINPAHPHTVDSGGKFQLLLTDGVDAAIELKPDISRARLLNEALTQSLSVKALRRAKSPLLLSSGKGPLYDHSLRTPSIIYAMSAKSSIVNTLTEVRKFYARRGTPLVDMVDAIVIHERAILATHKWPGSIGSTHCGWAIEEWGQDTLAGFVFHLLRHPASSAPTMQPVLTSYLKPSGIRCTAYHP